MPTEMTPAEIADELETVEGLCLGHENLSPIEYSALKYAASICRKLAEGKLREVVHGDWRLNNAGYHVCSVCGGQPGFEDWVNGKWQLPGWCFYCGNPMDGKGCSDGQTD